MKDHFEVFIQVYEDRYERQHGFFRPYIQKVIYRYLDCGDLNNRFAHSNKCRLRAAIRKPRDAADVL